MKRLLLDTHVLLWWLTDDEKLGQETKGLIADPRNEIIISAASNWEISIKRSLGKLEAPEDMDSVVEDNSFLKLPISPYHGDQAGLLPNIHRDPFDRMLIAQAQAEGLILVTADDKIIKYPFRTMDARS